MATFSTRLKELRTQRQLTQLLLAEQIGVNKQTISQYERGVRRPDLETLEALCDFFNVSADFILGKADITMRFVTSDDLAILNGFSDPELELLKLFRGLNSKGKDTALSTLAAYSLSPEFQKDTVSPNQIVTA